MELYNVIVEGQEIRLDGSPHDMAVPSVGYAFCRFEFHGDEWSEGTKKGVFMNSRDEVAYEMSLDGDGMCEIPHEVLQHTGTILVGAVTRDVNGEELNKLIPSYQAVLGRLTEVPIDGENSIPPTPEAWEQSLSACRTASDQDVIDDTKITKGSATWGDIYGGE